jgi:hypothetical protein
MQTLQIDEKQAKKLYKTASTEFKQVLHDSFGEKFFTEKITDRVKSYEDALEVLGRKAPDFSNLTLDEVCYIKLKTVIKALNESWTPDWNNGSEQKWYNWFYMDAPGFRCYDASFDCTDSGVGSRLCFRTRELAEYAAKQFLDLYRGYMII